MITTATVIKEMLNSPIRTIKGKVEFYKGSTLAFTANGEDILKDFAIQRAGEESKFFGFGICQKLTVNILDPQRAKTILKGDSCQVYLGAEEEYSAPYPRFYTEDVARDENTNELQVTAYDALYGAGALTVSDLSAAAPYTIESFATACAHLIGLEGISIVGVSDNSFAASYASGANFDGSESIRNALNAIAEITQTIYFINNSNELVFKRLNENENSVLDITKDKYFTLKSQSARVLGKIVHATELGDNLEAGAAGDVQYIRDNPFWTLLPSTDVAARLEAAIAAIGGLTIIPFECDWRGNFLLEPGDKVTLTAKDDSVFSTYILEDTVEYNGALHGKTKWSYQANKNETAANPTTIGEKLNQTFARVDKIEKEIKLYVGEVVSETVDELVGEAITDSIGGIETDINNIKRQLTTTTEKVTQLELDTDSIDLRVSNVETVQESQSGSLVSSEERISNLEVTAEGLNSSVSVLQTNIEETNGYIDAQTEQLRSEIQQSESALQIDIQTIKEQGANKVITSTGYTFNEEGLTISKSNSDISTQITENGMTVRNATTELLTANSDGVSATDLHARTYLIIGDRSRFENYGTSRTGCFWIGD